MVGGSDASALLGVDIPRKTFSAGVKVAYIGNSQFQFMTRYNSSGRALDTKQLNAIELCNARLEQRFKSWAWENGTNLAGANQGISGYKVSDLLTQLDTFIPQALASNIKIVVVEIGANGDNTLDANTRIGQMATAIARLKAAGFVLILSQITPRDVVGDVSLGWVTGDPRWQWRIDFNNWLLTQARNNVYIWRTNPALLLSPATGQPEQIAQYMTKDDAHFAAKGAWLWSSYDLDTIFNTIIPSGTWLAPFSDVSNLFTNYNVAGTNGVLGTGATVAGDSVGGGNGVATSCTIERISGDGTIVARKNVLGEQELTCTNVSTDTMFYFRHTATGYITALNALGSTAYALLAVKFARENWNGFDQTYGWLYDSASGFGYRTMSDTDSAYGGTEATLPDMTIATNPVVRDSWTSMRSRMMVIRFYANHPRTGAPITGTGKITIKNIGVFQTTDPSAEFALTRLAQ